MAVVASRKNAKEACLVVAVCAIAVNASSPTRSNSHGQRMYFYTGTLVTCILTIDSEEDRVTYMERLLQHQMPHLSLDVSSLKKAVDELQTRHRGSSGSVDVEDLEDLAIEDEDFVIKPMPDNTSRMLSWFLFWFLSWRHGG